MRGTAHHWRPASPPNLSGHAPCIDHGGMFFGATTFFVGHRVIFRAAPLTTVRKMRIYAFPYQLAAFLFPSFDLRMCKAPDR